MQPKSNRPAAANPPQQKSPAAPALIWSKAKSAVWRRSDRARHQRGNCVSFHLEPVSPCVMLALHAFSSRSNAVLIASAAIAPSEAAIMTR